jgi:anaerobic magnesium-protoporphyrin IX monomethyl ester cyclase
MKIAFIHLNAGWPRPSLGIAYLIASVRKAGHAAVLIDPTFFKGNRRKFIFDRIKQARPDVLAFNSVYYEDSESLELARISREINPGMMTIFGGVYPTLSPGRFMKNKNVDCICVGEGEKTIPEYLDSLEKNGPADIRVPGIHYRGPSGRIIKNEERELCADLDSLCFPDWSDWDVQSYLKTAYPFSGGIGVLSSRGCPFRCSFCMNSLYKDIYKGKHYRIRTPENVISELLDNHRKYRKYGLRYFYFHDETFGYDADNFARLMQLFVSSGLSKKMKWACGTRADIIDEGWVIAAKKAGCINVNLGIETIDDNLRNSVYRKNLSRKQIDDACTALNKHNVPFSANLIISPYESHSQIRESFSWVKKRAPMFIHIGPLMVLPETERHKGESREDFFTYKKMLPYQVSEGCSKEDVIRMTLEFNAISLIYFFFKQLMASPAGSIRKLFEFIFNINLARPTPLSHPSMMLYASRTLVYDTSFDVCAKME